MTSYQYELAVERTEYYHTQRYRSIVPMVQLSWNLARDVGYMADKRLYRFIRSALHSSLRQCQQTLEYARTGAKKEVVWYGRTKAELAHYCEMCEVCVICTLQRLLLFAHYNMHC